MKEVKAKGIEGWGLSLSMLFGTSPNFTITCGKCGGYFNRRFKLIELKNRNPKTVCPYCDTINKVPISY